MWIKRGAYEPIPGRVDRWRATEETIYRCKYGDFTVPVGFDCDLATIPKFMQWLYPKDGKSYAHAAMVHDMLCRKSHPASWYLADKVFYLSLKDSGVWFLRRRTMFNYVRAWHWLRGTKQEAGPLWPYVERIKAAWR
jgi:hypothetical protein